MKRTPFLVATLALVHLDHVDAQWILTAPVNVTDMATGNGRVVSVGWNSGGIQTSPNGIAWSSISELSARSVNYGGGFFWVVTPGYELWRTNGANAPVLIKSGLHVAEVAFGNGMLVASGFSTHAGFHYSPDGVNWTPALVPADADDYESEIGFLNGLFVATARTNLFTSTNGMVWELKVSDNSNPPDSFACGNGVYLTISASGTKSWRSPTGLAWVPCTSSPGHQVKAIHYANGTFFAVGTNGKISTSADGLSWTLQTSGVTFTLESASSINGVLLAAGTQIIRSPAPPVNSLPTIFIRHAIEVQFYAEDSVLYRIEGSPDLNNWTTVEAQIVGHGELTKRLYSTENQPNRFFRVATE